jgi:hypothetical protein
LKFNDRRPWFMPLTRASLDGVREGDRVMNPRRIQPVLRGAGRTAGASTVTTVTTVATAVVFLATAVFVLGAPAAAVEEVDWELIGAEDAAATGATREWCYYGGINLILSTRDGFRTYDNSGNWTVYEEPGVPGRETRATVHVFRTCGPFLSGRVDQEGHGYIERSEDGAPGAVVYSSATGPFVDLYPGRLYVDDMFACSRAGESPGQLVHSLYRGLTWEVVTGHGQQDLTDLHVSLFDDALLVAGDAGVSRSLDFGASWEDISSGLPQGGVRHLWYEGDPVLAVDDESRQDHPLLACTAQGLYRTNADVIDWQPVLPEGCRHASHQYLAYRNPWVSVVTDDGRILVAEEGSWDWADITGALAPYEILQVLPYYPTYYVITADAGVFRADVMPAVGGDVPEALARLTLSAAPNPFNPGTTIRFDVPHAGHAVLAVHDLAGRRVATLLDGPVPAGPGSVVWRPRELASGVYLARLVVGEESASQRLVLMK